MCFEYGTTSMRPAAVRAAGPREAEGLSNGTSAIAVLILAGFVLSWRGDTPAAQKTVLDFGARCDGVSVDNAAFLAALAATGSAVVPENRVCVVDRLEIPGNSRIRGVDNQTSVIKAGPGNNIFTFTGTATAHKADLSIENLSFLPLTGANVPGTVVLNAIYADNVSMLHNISTEIQLLCSNREFPYWKVLPAWLNRNTTFSGNVCRSRQVKHDACGEFAYVDGVTARNNMVYGFRDALFYWGGDADKTGAASNPRWARNVDFTGNYVDGSNGGIWGSMGQGVLFSMNTVRNLQDVGIDFEGTVDGKAIGNTCTEAIHGCATVFFLNRKIVFTGNTITQSNAAHPLLRLYGSTLPGKNEDISITRNTFYCTDRKHTCVIDNQSGKFRGLLFSGNSLSHTTVELGAKNFRVP